MTRLARIVVPNYPHHIIQRGNRRQKVFFNNQDKIDYLNIIKKHAQKSGIEFWAYCLMDNHVHLIAVPKEETSLARGIGEAHRNYTSMINNREGWSGYLWQGRFLSYPLDEFYLYSAIRYIENNPVRAGLVEKAEDYLWSSAKSHVSKEKDILCCDNFVISEIKDWSLFLAERVTDKEINRFKEHTCIGRPFGEEKFLIKLEKKTGRILRKRKPGPKKNN
ncbi:MAG: transposase [Elusimicrobiota bacterium]